MTSTSPSYRRVPIVHETLADLDTPLSVYLKLANSPYSYLLESAQNAGDDGEKWGRYSIIGLPARTIIKVTGSLVEVISDGEITESIQTDDPLTFVEEFQKRFAVENIEGLP
ncbi:MAG TPA: anthranilate synthase component I, partial [Gammaproteobacteria bacterium]|nr:anthranilate synthase component I [Gammaproteobacteria bacterium]